MAADWEVEALGALAPFTSPALIGARIGVAVDGALVLTLAGGGGPLEWACLLHEPRVTLHDRFLMRSILAETPALSGPVGAVTPRRVAVAALAAALSGAAGRVARRAAAMTQQRQEEDRQIAQFLLVVRLLEELGLEGMDWRHLSPSDPAFYDWLAASAARLAPALEPGTHDDGSKLAAWLEELADAAAPVGLPGDEYVPAAGQAMDGLAGLVEDLRNYAAGLPLNNDCRAAALRLADQGAAALSAAQTTVNDCHALLGDLCALRRDWAESGPRLKASCEKLDWALEGWRTAGMMWSEAAEDSARAAAVRDMERLLGRAPAADTLAAALSDPAAVDKIYRNELLKAAAA